MSLCKPWREEKHSLARRGEEGQSGGLLCTHIIVVPHGCLEILSHLDIHGLSEVNDLFHFSVLTKLLGESQLITGLYVFECT